MSNWKTLKEQMGDYFTEIREVIIPGIKSASEVAKEKDCNVVLYTLHKTSAFVEEWYDKMPRLQSYTFWVRLPVSVFLWASFLT
jgi:hypothetical protein